MSQNRLLAILLSVLAVLVLVVGGLSAVLLLSGGGDDGGDASASSGGGGTTTESGGGGGSDAGVTRIVQNFNGMSGSSQSRVKKTCRQALGVGGRGYDADLVAFCKLLQKYM